MKPAWWVAVTSLAGNVALIAVIVWAPGGPAAAGKASSPQSGVRLRAALESGDFVELEAAGASGEAVRALGVGRAYFRHMERMKTLRRNLDQATPPFWQDDSQTGVYSTKLRDMRMELFNASREFQEEIARLSGSSPSLSADPRLSMFAFLPDETRRRLAAIEREFSDLAHEVTVQAGGVVTAEDKEKQRVVAEERVNVIASLLGPEGYERYVLRTSPIAANVRVRYGSVIESEEEFRAIFELEREFAETFRAPTTRGPEVLAILDRNREAKQQLEHDIAAVLGADRMRQAKRNVNAEYNALKAIVARYQLPANTPDVVEETIGRYADFSQEILTVEGLTAAERTEQLRALGESAFAELDRTLGTSAAQAYAEHAEWLKALKQGHSLARSRALYWGSVGIFAR